MHVAFSLPPSDSDSQIGVPGAFTTPCTAHLPGYISAFDEFRAKGVSAIYVFAVNDVFVMK